MAVSIVDDPLIQYDHVERKMLRHLSKVKQTQLQMVHDRNYNIMTDPFIIYYIQQTGINDVTSVLDRLDARVFYRWYTSISNIVGLREPLNHIYTNNHNDQLLVFFVDPVSDNQNLSDKDIMGFQRLYFNSIQEGNSADQNTDWGVDAPIFESIFISPINISKSTMENLQKLNHINVWSEVDLISNPIKHHLQPHVRRLSDQEFVDLFARTGKTFDQLPRLYEDDVLAQYYGFRAGHVILVVSVSPLQISMNNLHIEYRAIVKNITV